MGKAEYSKKFPQLDKDANIFATMYISAQCQETEELLSYLYKLSRTLPNSSFANLAFGQSTRKKFKEIVKFLTEIMDLIDIGLNIKPNDSVGRSIKLRCQEIIRMIEDEILPSVEMHLGNKGIPDGLGIQVHDVYTIMNGLSSSLNLLRNSIQRVFLESE